MNRVLQPEILDHLKPDNPAAMAARRDLCKINFCMGNVHLLANALKTLPAPIKLAEIGCGDGAFLIALLRKFPSWQSVLQEIVLLDLQPALTPSIKAEYQNLGWPIRIEQINAEEWLRTTQDRFDLIICNLFLHHFSEEQLLDLFAGFSKVTCAFVACEPRRGKVPYFFAHLLLGLGCNDVTRHDAVVSVAAGFKDSELTAIWQTSTDNSKQWKLDESRAGPFSHLFTAISTHAPKAN